VTWGYEITPEAVRQLREMGPSAAAEIKYFLETRIKGAANPEQFGKPLRGLKHGFWRYRVRDWRILCRLENKVMIVIVVSVGHRSEIYD
jgi:mRNA interferase RelE/StbE